MKVEERIKELKKMGISVRKYQPNIDGIYVLYKGSYCLELYNCFYIRGDYNKEKLFDIVIDDADSTLKVMDEIQKKLGETIETPSPVTIDPMIIYMYG